VLIAPADSPLRPDITPGFDLAAALAAAGWRPLIRTQCRRGSMHARRWRM